VKRVNELLTLVGLPDSGAKYPAQLSGGQQQRVALARALATSPGLLLLDEPLSALDARTRAGAARELADVLHASDAPALLVTHDFTEAAQLGDRVGVIDDGRIVQEGTASELAAAPRSAFVADFTGAVVLTGTARAGADGLTHVRLDGGGEVVSADLAEGAVAVSVYPWEIAIEPADAQPHGSAQNRLGVEVLSVTTVGNRVRLGLAGPQPLAAEVTQAAVEQLGLRAGRRVTASWKAAATRLVSTTAEDRGR
jgi:molybdate transport system ATP-binding protein